MALYTPRSTAGLDLETARAIVVTLATGQQLADVIPTYLSGVGETTPRGGLGLHRPDGVGSRN